MAGAAGVDLDSPANRALARELAERSVVLLDAGTALPLLGDGPAGAAPGRRGRPVRRRPAHVHGLLRLPQPRAAPLPRPRARHRGADRARRAARRAARTPRSSTSTGCAVQGDDRSGFAAAVAAARDADLCVAVVGDLAGLFGHGTSGEGCDAEDLRLPGVQADLLAELARHRHAGRRGRRLRPPVRAGRRARPGRRRSSRRSCPARRAARRSPACSPAGSSPAASCRCRSPGTPGGQPGTYLQPPLGGAESAGHQQPRPDPAVPVRLRRARTPPSTVDDLRISATEVPHRRRVHRDRAGPQHRRRGPATRSSSSTCTTCSPRWPGRCGSWPGSPGSGWSRARRADVRFRVHADRTAFTGRDLRADRRARRHRGAVGTSAADLPCRGTRPAHRPAAGRSAHDRRLVTPVDVEPAAAPTRSEEDEMPCRPETGAPRWPPSPPPPACRSPPSPRCSTAAATSPRRPARGCRTCCSEHDYVGRRRATPGRARPTRRAGLRRRAQRLLDRGRSRASLDAGRRARRGRRRQPAPARAPQVAGRPAGAWVARPGRRRPAGRDRA